MIDYIKQVIRSSKPKRHKYYQITVAHAKEMGVHIEGFKPRQLLEEKRPNEPQEVEDYRLKVWKAVTKSLSSKIINTVNRIFNQRFFRVEYTETSKLIPQDEDLGTYLTEHFGIYQNIWIYIRETLLKMTFSDANALCVVLPEDFEAERFEPIPVIFRSSELVDFKDGVFYTIYQPPVGDSREGIVYYIDQETYQVFKTKNNKAELVFEWPHGFGFVPAFRLGGMAEGQMKPYYYSSFVSGVAPHWDKAVTMISDLDGSTVNHLFPSMWEWTDECEKCGGHGRFDSKTGQPWDGIGDGTGTRPCARCSGSGVITNKSPFGVHQVKRDALNPEFPSPIPPAGFIGKDIAPLQELKKSIETEIKAGYSSVNMEILFKSGENQSGVAKTIDRQDLDSFLMRISQHVFEYQLPQIIQAVAYWRYPIPGINKIVEGVKISKPKDFSILGVNDLIAELKDASNSNVSTSFLKHIEIELVNTKFANNDFERKRNIAVIELKPFPNRTPEQLSTLVQNGGIKKEDYIRNENIDDLVTMAILDDEKFLDEPFDKKLEIIEALIMDKYIKEEIEEEEKEEEITPEIIPEEMEEEEVQLNN